jgi:hypothetical protein
MGSLLSGMPHSLLPNMTVHRPVCNLLSACIAADDIEKTEFSLFLFTLSVHLRKDNQLTEFFLQETDQVHPTDPNKHVTVLLPFKGLVKRYKDDGLSGDKSKEGILLFLQIESATIIESIWKFSDLSEQLVTIWGSKINCFQGYRLSRRV